MIVMAILDAVRQECEEQGIPIVANCFDGTLATRGVSNEPLTLLQFSKDVWNSVCAIPKQQMVKEMTTVGKADGLETFSDVVRIFNVEFTYDSENNFNAPIMLGRPKAEEKYFKTPLN